MSDTEEQAPPVEQAIEETPQENSHDTHTEEYDAVPEQPHTQEPEQEPEPEQEQVAGNGTTADDDADRPVIELFVKAAVDKMKNGSCPICHRYFLIFYILRERGLVDLVVTTFLPENPPKEVRDFSNGKRYPLVKVHKGVDSQGLDMTGVDCETVDEIESLIDRFDCEDMKARRESSAEAKAEKTFEDLYVKFNQYLKKTSNEPHILVKALEKIDGYLRQNESMFMLGDRLARADCYLLPTLQHLRVAGKAYRDFEIPTELVYVWRYLKNAYDTDAFKESCPADREIITHYDGKAANRAKIPGMVGKRASLMAEDRTFSVPEAVFTGNGAADDDE